MINKLFQGKTLIISGGLGDIGRAVGLAFADHGASVALCDIQPEAAAEGLLAQISQTGVRADYCRVDITDPLAVRTWVQKVEDALGVPGIIVANAATATFGSIYEISPDQWIQELNVNLNGAFHLAQSATARLIHHHQPGRLVFMGSWAAHAIHTELTAYCVSKAAIRMLSKCLARELAPHHILVNELALGFVDAGLTGKRFKEVPGSKEQAVQKVPLNALITPQEVAWQVVQMCHPQNTHVTGTTLLMDGGLSLL